MAQLTQADIAAHLDISTRNLRDVLKELGIDWRQSSLDQIRIAYIRRLRESAAGRSEQDLAIVRARKELAQARREELELAREYRLIAPVDEVRPAIVGFMRECLAEITQAGKKVTQNINAQYQVTVSDDIVLGPLRAALGNLAGSGDQLVSALEGVPCGAVSAAAAADGGVDRKEHSTAG